jgi:hypothetical protein
MFDSAPGTLGDTSTVARHGPHPAAVAATTDEARAGRSERELRLLADPARAVEATKAVLAEGGERAERFFRAGFEIAYAAYNRRDWELNTLFCDIDYVFRPGSSDQQLIDANREYRGIDGYLEAQQLLLDIWAGVRIELIGVHLRPPAQVVTDVRWRGRAAHSGLAMEWNTTNDNRYRDGLAIGQTFWWDRERAERALGFTLADRAR